MKICDVVLNSIWYDPRVRKQIVEYIDNGIDLSCVGLKCPRYDEEKIKNIPVKTNVVKINPKYEGQQKCILKKIIREYLGYKNVRDAIIQESPDIIHANDLNALIPAYAASKRLKCLLVYDSHEINVENYTSTGRSKTAFLMEIIEKYIVKRVSLMVCVSNAAADYFCKKYKINKPMVVTNCSLKKEQISSRKIDKHDGFEVLNHGQFYEGRGYDVMAQSCESLKNYNEIKLAIRGFGKLEPKLHEIVNENEGKNFIFYPPVNVENLISEAAASHVGVAITESICLNFELSVSNKIFEYASAGLPVIMSNIPEHRYLNEKYHFGVIMEDVSVQSFVQAVLKLYNDYEFYKECSENAKRMSQELNWENEFYKLIQLEEQMYKSVRK